MLLSDERLKAVLDPTRLFLHSLLIPPTRSTPEKLETGFAHRTYQEFFLALPLTTLTGVIKKGGGLAHCPVTRLVPLAQGEATPIRESSDLRKYSPAGYEGFFHTDHLIPSAFFSKERDPKELTLYDNLSLQYIYDPAGDPEDHKELMTGTEATWYDVKRNLDRLPDFVDPEKTTSLTDVQRGRLARWLEGGRKERLVP